MPKKIVQTPAEWIEDNIQRVFNSISIPESIDREDLSQQIALITLEIAPERPGYPKLQHVRERIVKETQKYIDSKLTYNAVAHECDIYACSSVVDEDLALEAAVYAEALQESIKDVLSTLTPREARVIKLRFGLEDGCTHTLEEVGKEFSVGRERIREIEAKCLRKLRHPSRVKKLRGFLYEDGGPCIVKQPTRNGEYWLYATTPGEAEYLRSIEALAATVREDTEVNVSTSETTVNMPPAEKRTEENLEALDAILRKMFEDEMVTTIEGCRTKYAEASQHRLDIADCVGDTSRTPEVLRRRCEAADEALKEATLESYIKYGRGVVRFFPGWENTVYKCMIPYKTRLVTKVGRACEALKKDADRILGSIIYYHGKCTSIYYSWMRKTSTRAVNFCVASTAVHPYVTDLETGETVLALTNPDIYESVDQVCAAVAFFAGAIGDGRCKIEIAGFPMKLNTNNFDSVLAWLIDHGGICPNTVMLKFKDSTILNILGEAQRCAERHEAVMKKYAGDYHMLNVYGYRVAKISNLIKFNSIANHFTPASDISSVVELLSALYDYLEV